MGSTTFTLPIPSLDWLFFNLHQLPHQRLRDPRSWEPVPDYRGEVLWTFSYLDQLLSLISFSSIWMLNKWQHWRGIWRPWLQEFRPLRPKTQHWLRHHHRKETLSSLTRIMEMRAMFGRYSSNRPRRLPESIAGVTRRPEGQWKPPWRALQPPEHITSTQIATRYWMICSGP